MIEEMDEVIVSKPGHMFDGRRGVVHEITHMVGDPVFIHRAMKSHCV